MRAVCSGLVLTAILLLDVRVAAGQAMIKVSDDVNVKFGILLQAQGDWLQEPVSGGYGQNLFLRRARFLVAGNLAKNLSFFFETDNPNLGKSAGGTKTISTGLIVQDAYAEYRFSDEFQLGAGLILAGFARNNLQSAASLLAVDYGAYSFLYSAPEQNVVGRDTGFQLRGYPAAKRLEYRIGVYQGQRDAQSRQSFRTTARLQYNFLDPEATGMFYTGTYLGKKKVFAIGAGCDAQKDYKSWAADAFFDYPLGGGGLTAQLDWIRYDGGDTFKNLLKQDILFAEAGYYIASAKVMPFASYSSKDISGTETGDETRWLIGFGYLPYGHNMNLKLAYGRIEPKNGTSVNQFTIQLQGFYF